MDTRLGIRRLVPRRVSICFCTQSTDQREIFDSKIHWTTIEPSLKRERYKPMRLRETIARRNRNSSRSSSYSSTLVVAKSPLCNLHSINDWVRNVLLRVFMQKFNFAINKYKMWKTVDCVCVGSELTLSSPWLKLYGMYVGLCTCTSTWNTKQRFLN